MQNNPSVGLVSFLRRFDDRLFRLMALVGLEGFLSACGGDDSTLERDHCTTYQN